MVYLNGAVAGNCDLGGNSVALHHHQNPNQRTQLLLGESYQADQVRTSCVAQEMRGEALKGDRRRPPCGDDHKLCRDRGERRMRRCAVNDAEVERFTR